jgi:hypothetical protein
MNIGAWTVPLRAPHVNKAALKPNEYSLQIRNALAI